jgi:hypothetical protein
MAKEMSVFDGANWRTVDQPSVFDGANWRDVNVAWVYEPAAFTLTGWTVVFGTLTPTVSMTDISSTGNDITLSWNSTNQEFIKITYWLQDRFPQGIQYPTGGWLKTSQTSYTINSVSPESYTVLLEVQSETGNQASTSSNIIVPLFPTVNNFTLTSKTYNSASFSWQSTNQSTYRIILYFESGDGTGQIKSGEISSTSDRSYSFSNLNPGVEYTPQIIIKSSTGNTASLMGNPFTTDPPPAPTNITLPAISGTRAVGSNRSVTNGTWSGVGPIFYRYQWVRSLNNSTWSNISGANSSTYTLSSSDIGYYVTCRVGARVIIGSSASNWTDVLAPSTLGTVGSVPGSLTLTVSNITYNSARFTWTNSSGATQYNLFAQDVNGGGFASRSYFNVSSPYTPTNLSSNINYVATVAAINDFGVTNSNQAFFTTPSPPPPAPTIASFNASVGVGSVTFTWSASNATSYSVRVFNQLGSNTYSTTSTSLQVLYGPDEDLTPNTSYTATLTATGPGGSTTRNVSFTTN